jgi:hypothetical protein
MLHKPSPTAIRVLKGLAGKLNLAGVEMRAINYNVTQRLLRNENSGRSGTDKIQEILNNISQLVLASIRTGYKYI